MQQINLGDTMSHIVFSVTPTPGHVNPLILIAKHLKEQGHSIVFQCADVFKDQIEAVGLQFAPLEGLANHDYRESKTIWPELATAEPGIPQLNAYMKAMASLIPEQDSSLRKIIGSQPVDLIIVDFLFLGSLPMLLSPRNQRPPFLTLGVTPVLLRTSGVSPISGPDDSPEGLERNAAHNHMFGELLAPGTDCVDDVLQPFGVSIEGGFTWDSLYTVPDMFLQLSAEEFEYPMREKPRSFAFAGPVAPPNEANPNVPEWLRKLDPSKPVVFVTQGGVANIDLNELVKPALEALADEDVEVVITGGSRDVSEFAGIANAHVERYLSYDLILPKTSIFITNGGFTGVQQALSYGVPVIVAGSTEEKPMVAARAAWSGAGIDLKTGKPSPEQIRNAVRTVLSDPTFQSRAKALKSSFGDYNALQTINEAVESAVAHHSAGTFV
jgi:MGT family glycosyltransferase